MDRRAKGRDLHRGDVRRLPRPSCCPQVRLARTVSGLATATGLPTDVAATLAPLAHSDSVLQSGARGLVGLWRVGPTDSGVQRAAARDSRLGPRSRPR